MSFNIANLIELPGRMIKRVKISIKNSFKWIKKMIPMKNNDDFSFRHFYMVFFMTLVLLVNFLLDPKLGLIQELPFGTGLIATLVDNLKIVVYVALFYISMRGLFDYVDREDAWDRIQENPIAISIFIVGLGLFGIALAIIFHAVITS